MNAIIITSLVLYIISLFIFFLLFFIFKRKGSQRYLSKKYPFLFALKWVLWIMIPISSFTFFTLIQVGLIAPKEESVTTVTSTYSENSSSRPYNYNYGNSSKAEGYSYNKNDPYYSKNDRDGDGVLTDEEFGNAFGDAIDDYYNKYQDYLN